MNAMPNIPLFLATTVCLKVRPLPSMPLLMGTLEVATLATTLKVGIDYISYFTNHQWAT